MATTTLDYAPNETPLPRTGEDRHGRSLKFRVEEVLDIIPINYQFDFNEYLTYYSVQNLYIQDAETTKHLLLDTIPRSTMACY